MSLKHEPDHFKAFVAILTVEWHQKARFIVTVRTPRATDSHEYHLAAKTFVAKREVFATDVGEGERERRVACDARLDLSLRQRRIVVALAGDLLVPCEALPVFALQRRLAHEPKVIEIGEPTGKGRELEIIATNLTFKVTMIARRRHDRA